MSSFLPRIVGTLLALGAGASPSIINQGDTTDLPISPTGGMTVLKPTEQSVYGATDSGLIWAPKPEETSVQETDAGARGATTPHPESGVTGKCAPIAQKIAHRRAYLDALEKKSNEVGWEQAAQAYCGMHPDEVECTRPPIAVEQELSDLIVDDPNQRPDTDGWIVTWLRELQACKSAGVATPRPSRRK